MINDIFINIKELDIELKNMQKTAESFEIKFSLLSQTIAYIFDKIKTCQTFNFDSGNLQCVNCDFDTSACIHITPEFCGDNIINNYE